MNFKQFKQKALENPEIRREYDSLQDEFSLIDQLITMRTKAGLRRTLRKNSEPTKATYPGLSVVEAIRAGERSVNMPQPADFG